MRYFISVVFLILAGCSAEHYETNARIVERRLLPDSQLMIKYAFQAGDRTIVDSVRTRNRVIPHDSVRVRYSTTDPRKNALKF